MIKKVLKKIIPQKGVDTLHLLFALGGVIKYKNPSKELIVIGITGTSGKSTVTAFLREMLEQSGHVVGSLSTVDFTIAGKTMLNDQKMTMLGHSKIQKFLRKMVQKKCTVAIIESTSQGALQHRHKFIHFDTFGITNLYHEHIEAHGSFEAYKQAKMTLFHYMSTLPNKVINNKTIKKSIVVNADIPSYQDFTQFKHDQEFLFGEEPGVEGKYLYNNINQTKNGLSFDLNGQTINANNIAGVHNASNITCAYLLAKSIGVPQQTIVTSITNISPVPGRLEYIAESKKYGFDVIVDYAFEPVAMKALYDTIISMGYKNIIHVLGATGGGRDRSRREPLGYMAGIHAKMVVITNEDPYDEDPIEIMKDVERGVIKAGKEIDVDYAFIEDRKKAINFAISIANKDDVIIITGKGSEQGMCIANGEMISWDDRKIAKKAIIKSYANKKD